MMLENGPYPYSLKREFSAKRAPFQRRVCKHRRKARKRRHHENLSRPLKSRKQYAGSRISNHVLGTYHGGSKREQRLYTQGCKARLRRESDDIMISVTVIALGKLKESYMRDFCAEYEKRLKAFCKINITELSPVRLSQNPSEGEIKRLSTARLRL